jgi:hypothetical protein
MMTSDWERVVAFFADRFFAASHDSSPPTMTELIKQFHEEIATIGMARTTLHFFHMPSAKMMQHIRRKFKVQGTTDKELAILEKQVRLVAAAYCDLFNPPD